MILLNAIVLIYLVSVFLIHKAFILKHHKKSHVFNEDIPVMSIFFLKLAVILHMFIGFYSFTEYQKLSISTSQWIKDMRESNLSILYNKQIESDKDGNSRLSSNVGFIYSLFIQILIIAFIIKVIFSFIKSILSSMMSDSKVNVP